MKSSVESSISARVYMVLTEEEVRALLGIIAYGADEFLKCFFTHLGKAYLEDHTGGLKSLFSSIAPIERELERIDAVRKEFEKRNTQRVTFKNNKEEEEKDNGNS